VKINYVVGLLIAILAIIIAFQNGEEMLTVDLLFLKTRTSSGLLIIGSLIAGLILGNLLQIKAK
jgi:uncharacterized integral membrane protein